MVLLIHHFVMITGICNFSFLLSTSSSFKKKIINFLSFFTFSKSSFVFRKTGALSILSLENSIAFSLYFFHSTNHFFHNSMALSFVSKAIFFILFQSIFK
ncbi:TPA: hypothetical protein DEG21_05555 [Patescibacteria group bacterium]|nr:hypothetical protein [Candidatus Gracilibacteria bacterium]HBY75288.1 hypothetical protein [Candidatus Gracilibacteria bacterium]